MDRFAVVSENIRDLNAAVGLHSMLMALKPGWFLAISVGNHPYIWMSLGKRLLATSKWKNSQNSISELELVWGQEMKAKIRGNK